MARKPLFFGVASTMVIGVCARGNRRKVVGVIITARCYTRVLLLRIAIREDKVEVEMQLMGDKIAQLRTMIVIVELVRLRDASASLATFPSSAVIRMGESASKRSNRHRAEQCGVRQTMYGVVLFAATAFFERAPRCVSHCREAKLIEQDLALPATPLHPSSHLRCVSSFIAFLS
jgi:hypothetical protein